MLFAAAFKLFCREQYVHAEHRSLFFIPPHIDFTARLFLFTALIYSARPIRKDRHLPAAAFLRCFVVFVCRCGSVQVVLVRGVQFSFKCRINETFKCRVIVINEILDKNSLG